MGRMWRGGYRRFHPIGDRMGNEMVDAFDVGQPICDLDMEYGVYKVPAKEVIPYRIYPVLSPAWKADGYDELGIIYDRYLDLLVTYVVEGESETDGYAAAIVTYDNLDTFGLPRGKLFEYASRNLKSDIRIGFTGTTGQLAMLEIGRLSGGVGGASPLLLSSVWESAVKLLGTEKIIFFALSNCELMAVVAEERIIHALKSGLFDAARESVPVEEYFPKSIYGLVSDRSGYLPSSVLKGAIYLERSNIRLLFGCYSAIILAYCINGRRIRMEENSFQVALRSALSELKDGSMVELSERDPGFRQSEMEEHLAEQDWLKISHEIPQELRDVTDRFIRAVRVHACDQVDTAYLAGMRDMMKIAAAFGLYEIDPDDVLPARQRK